MSNLNNVNKWNNGIWIKGERNMSSSKISVLIADDNKEFCNILNDYLLNQRDIVVVGIANNGIEALELIEEKKPDLVILDIIMPHLDGLGVLEKLNSSSLEKGT